MYVFIATPIVGRDVQAILPENPQFLHFTTINFQFVSFSME